MKKSKAGISFFLLCLFLYPFAVTEIHHHHHKDDLHCNDKSSFHFHQEEHHCTVCDFIQGFSDKDELPHLAIFQNIVTGKTLSLKTDFHYSFPSYLFSLRAPPIN
jgi:hypothetical protein